MEAARAEAGLEGRRGPSLLAIQTGMKDHLTSLRPSARERGGTAPKTYEGGVQGPP